MGAILLVVGVLAMGGLLWSGVSCIQGGATARYEADSLAKSNEIKDADIELRDYLLAKKTAEQSRDRTAAEVEKASILAARDREAARAEDEAKRAALAEESASHAWSKVEDLEGRECPVLKPVECPVLKPEVFCRWDCVRPPLEE